MTIYYVIIFFLLAIIIVLSIALLRLRRQTRQISLGLDEISEETLKEIYHLSARRPRYLENPWLA